MSDVEVPPHVWVSLYETCSACNYGNHRCHFCGEDLDHESFVSGGRRHWLSDCRPDLVEHEPGSLCTWPLMGYGTTSWTDAQVDEFNEKHGRPSCYAYEDRETREWGTEHIHFYRDGPMV